VNVVMNYRVTNKAKYQLRKKIYCTRLTDFIITECFKITTLHRCSLLTHYLKVKPVATLINFPHNKARFDPSNHIRNQFIKLRLTQWFRAL
jgi:hypothetical protein